MDLGGKRVLVTGASRGIGEAVAIAFANAGSRVALVARSEGPLKELATRLGGTAHPVDLSDPDAVDGLIERIEADGGPIDVLVNNAGLDMAGDFVTMDPRDLEQIFRVNLVTPVQLTRQVLPLMLARGGGHIVNMSSMAGNATFPGLTAYSSTKAALTHFTSGLRADLKGKPIGTTVVELGPIPTDMRDHVFEYKPTADSFKRSYRVQLLVDVSKETVANDVVVAVRKNRRHVRHPKRAVLFPLLSEAPRRMVELLLTGVRHQAD